MSLLNPSDSQSNRRPLDEHRNNEDNNTHREGRRRLEKQKEEVRPIREMIDDKGNWCLLKISLRHKNDTRTPADSIIDDLEFRVGCSLLSRRLMPESQPSDHIRSPTHEGEYLYGKLETNMKP